MGYYIEVEKGVKVFVEDTGTGRPVLFIHGWPVNHRMYEYQVSQLTKYGFRCIQLDLRGFGRSDSPWIGYNYDRMADDVRAVIDTLRLDHVKLVGFSMGGAISIRYMACHAGHRISQLILLGAAAPSFTQRPGYPYGMTKEQVNSLIEATNKDRPQMLEDFGKLFFEKKHTESFLQWFHSLGLDASPQGTVACAVSLRDEDLRQDLAKILVPTTIFHGVKDKICPFEFAILMRNGIKGSTLVRFEHSGHGLFYDELDKFNEQLLMALNQVRFQIG